ncbi:DUF3047 domain-containing protein [Vibrio sp. JC009]|uniref:DUF3047 domain-containing protein n=1 Tax=Vibrio sp. JC009 TaxID=2912314 RepID=UPI0023AF598B|nr:DUF3047 domain-containing protein [Vibrio sp. JC009]WED22899.1 DUF3047 domain-containing protein [Vibrio sp. JC009]
MHKILFPFIYLLGSASVFSAEAAINVTQFAEQDLSIWKEKSFSGYTQYAIVEQEGGSVLQANSSASASGLALERKIDLLKTPYINWSWMTQTQLMGFDELAKSGDDYSARIYLVLDGGWQIWKTKALNYVWSGNQPEASRWDNAFAGSNAKMIAVKGKEAELNQWYREKRNVYKDLISAFGDKGSDKKNQKAYRYVDVVAIMTDTDNSGQQATAYYGDIIFTAD